MGLLKKHGQDQAAQTFAHTGLDVQKLHICQVILGRSNKEEKPGLLPT